MNEEYQRKIAIMHLDHSVGHKRNVIVLNNNSFTHELAKFLLSWELYKSKSPFISEALFKNRVGKADVYELDTMTAYEILVTETDERLAAKREHYPRNVTVIGIKAGDLIKKHLGEWLK